VESEVDGKKLEPSIWRESTPNFICAMMKPARGAAGVGRAIQGPLKGKKLTPVYK